MNPTTTATEPTTRRAARRSDAAKPRGRHRTAKEKAKYLSRFAASGMRPAAFCRDFGLCEQTFYAWRRLARGGGAAIHGRRPGFAQVSVKPPTAGTVEPPRVDDWVVEKRVRVWHLCLRMAALSRPSSPQITTERSGKGWRRAA